MQGLMLKSRPRYGPMSIGSFYILCPETTNTTLAFLTPRQAQLHLSVWSLPGRQEPFTPLNSRQMPSRFFLVFIRQNFLLRHLLSLNMVRWSRIWPLGWGTGSTIKQISGTCGSRARVACLGGRSTGSYGFALSIFPRERRRPHQPGLPLPHA